MQNATNTNIGNISTNKPIKKTKTYTNKPDKYNKRNITTIQINIHKQTDNIKKTT